MIQKLNSMLHLLSLRTTGTIFSLLTQLIPRMRSLTVWSIYGTSTSVWLHLTCHVLLPTMNQEQAVEWDSEIHVRIFLVLFILFQILQDREFLILQQHSLKTEVLTTSTSLLPSRVILILVQALTMILCGSSPEQQLISKKLMTTAFLMNRLPLTVTPQKQNRLWNI